MATATAQRLYHTSHALALAEASNIHQSCKTTFPRPNPKISSHYRSTDSIPWSKIPRPNIPSSSTSAPPPATPHQHPGGVSVARAPPSHSSNPPGQKSPIPRRWSQGSRLKPSLPLPLLLLPPPKNSQLLTLAYHNHHHHPKPQLLRAFATRFLPLRLRHGKGR